MENTNTEQRDFETPSEWYRYQGEMPYLYLGEVADYERHGLGKLYFGDSLVFEGKWVRDKRSGYGTQYHESGMPHYRGQWANDVPHGQGEYFDHNGALFYRGSFAEGKLEGTGVNHRPDGSIAYDGAFENGMWHGYGKLYRQDGSTYYEGEFANNKPEGHGKSFHPNGSVAYEGQWYETQPNGYGKCYRPDGTLAYDGEWKEGQREGRGKHFHKNGRLQFEGLVNGNAPNGEGKEFDSEGNLLYSGLFSFGSRYSGDWKEGIGAHGIGKLASTNPGNPSYEGEFRDGHRHGRGKEFLNGALVYEGEFFKGLKHGYGKDANGSSVFYFMDELGVAPNLKKLGIMDQADRRCPICFNKFTARSVISRLQCGHHFCTKCGLQLETCPLDRTPITKHDVISLSEYIQKF